MSLVGGETASSVSSKVWISNCGGGHSAGCRVRVASVVRRVQSAESVCVKQCVEFIGSKLVAV